jgi:branched-chain amino acid aminotransferase
VPGSQPKPIIDHPIEEIVMKLEIITSQNPKPKPDETKLGFGTRFSDHMFNMDYTPDLKWHNPRIEPYGPFTMDPATMVLHYGQGIFEGMKAYRTESGSIQLFRPRDNFKRLNYSARKLCIPEIDIEFVLGALKELLRVERDWVPSAPGTSLYIRPTIIATDPFLGVRASHTYRFFIILSPVGAYYAEGFNPIKIMVTRDHVRAVRGGVGDTKTLGNYAASLLAGQEAHDAGYTQVLWLDGVEQKYVEEVGAMNIFFVVNNTLITPALSGSILPGITRDSAIRLANSWDMPVSEQKISIDEVIAHHSSGALTEIFGSGTAAVISPVGELKYGSQILKIGDGAVGPIAQRFFDAIMDIQYSRVEDTMGWVEPAV